MTKALLALAILLPSAAAAAPAPAPALDPLSAGFQGASALFRPAAFVAPQPAPVGARADVERTLLEIFRRFDANLGALGHKPDSTESTAALDAAKHAVDPSGQAMNQAGALMLSDVNDAVAAEAKRAGLPLERYSDPTQPEIWAGLLAAIRSLENRQASLPPERLFAELSELKVRLVMQVFGSLGSGADANAQKTIQAVSQELDALSADILRHLNLPNVAKLG